MTDMNNKFMNDNDEHRDNDPKERMRKKVKKAAGIALCAVLAGGLAAGSFEGVNAVTGWNSSKVEAASSEKENTTFPKTPAAASAHQLQSGIGFSCHCFILSSFLFLHS